MVYHGLLYLYYSWPFLHITCVAPLLMQNLPCSRRTFTPDVCITPIQLMTHTTKVCSVLSAIIASPPKALAHYTDFHNDFSKKIFVKIVAQIKKLLRKLLQLWQKVVWLVDNYFFSSFSCCVGGPLPCYIDYSLSFQRDAMHYCCGGAVCVGPCISLCLISSVTIIVTILVVLVVLQALLSACFVCCKLNVSYMHISRMLVREVVLLRKVLL